MILLTIVIVVLCAVAALPAFSFSNGLKKWNPAVLQYDLGMDLGGGYYTYYYPEGVVPASDISGDEEKEYVQYKTSGLYFSAEAEDGIWYDGAPTQEFTDEFNALVKEVTARYEKKGLSDYRVSVVDDYSIKVEIPKAGTSYDGTAVENPSDLLTLFAFTGDLSIVKTSGETSETVDELKSKDAKITDLIEGFSIHTRYKASYLSVELTKKGKAMVKAVENELTSSTDTSSSSAVTLDFKIGEATLFSVYKDSIASNYELRPIAVNDWQTENLETYKIVLESALNGGFDISLTLDEINSFAPVYGDNVMTLLFIALGVCVLACIVLPIVKAGRYGVVNAYSVLSYFIITTICFAFITKGVLEITLGTALVFLLGMILISLFNLRTYDAIKSEFQQGKTVVSAVKAGNKKSLWGMVDTYAVLLLAALAMLIGAAGLHTLAIESLICVVAAAFCNIFWTRGINFVFLSASKDKYKYFRFVREDDDDE